MGISSFMTGELLREKWRDYAQRFRPIEDSIMSSTTYVNPGLAQTAVNDATQYTNSSYNAAEQSSNRAIAGYGGNFDSDQVAANTKSMAMGKTAAIVDAANKIRTRLMDRNREIAFGSIPNTGVNQTIGGQSK